MRRAAAAVLLALTLAGCSSPAPDLGDPLGSTDQAGPAPDVDVADDELVALRTEAGIAACPEPTGARSEAADPLPDVTLACLGGGPDVRLSELTGPLVLNVWASWCGPCRDELPLLQQLHEVGGEELRVLGIDFKDTRPGDALRLAAEAGVTYASMADPAAELAGDLQVIALPVTLLVDADGSVAYVHRGPVTSYDQLTELVLEHLAVELPGAS